MSRVLEFRSRFTNPIAKYAVAAALCVIAVALRLLLNPVLGQQSRYAFLMPTMLLCTIFLGFEQGLLVTLLGTFLTVLLVIPPMNSLAMSRADVGALIVFLSVSTIILWLTQREINERRHRMEIEQELAEVNHALERKVQERTAELKAANDELEAFCYSMAHDLRTPTRAIAGNARILLEDYRQELRPELNQNLERINVAALKLGSLVDGLLTYARLGKQDMQSTEVNVGAIVADLAHSEAKRAKVDVELNIPRNFIVRADERQFRVLLRSLVDNAILYRKPGEPVSIELRRFSDEIVFADKGIGFEMAYAEKVLMPFERLHRDEAYPGVGMGLANVERVVRRHGGQVYVESTPGVGTEVHLILPGMVVPERALVAAMANVR